MKIGKRLLISLAIGSIFLQPFRACAQPFNFTVYREADGLPSGYIQRVFEDSRGYLWICTFGGLSRFDGRNFKNYDIKDGLPGNFCDDICEDRLGNLWIGTRRGLCYFDGKNMTTFNCVDSLTTCYFSNLKVDEQNHLKCGLNGKNAEVHGIKVEYVTDSYNLPGSPTKKFILKTIDDGTTIINTDNGIYTISVNKTMHKVEPSVSNINCIYFHPTEKNAFYFFNQNGIYHWQNGIAKSLSKENFEGQIVTALLVDNKKRVWISSEGKGIWIIDNNKTTFIDKNQLPGYLVPSIYQDKRGVIWICTFRGLVKLTDQFTSHFTKATGLDNEDIRGSNILSDGSICMQTTIIKNGVPSLLPDNLSNKLEFNQFKTYTASLELANDKSWWIFAHNRGFYQFKNHHLKNVSTLYDTITSTKNVYDKRTNSLWVGHGNYLCEIRDEKIVSRINTLADNSKLNSIYSINKDDSGNIWVSEKYRMLIKTAQGLVDLTPTLQLSKTIFACFACNDKSGVWIKTQGLGAIHFVFVNNRWIKDKSINTDNGLPNNIIHDIEVDSKQNIWIATLNGLYRFTENKETPNAYNIRSFGKSEGIDVPNWNLAFLEKDSLNNIWLGVANGIFKINTQQIEESILPPSVLIEKVNVLNDADAEIAATDGFEVNGSKAEFESGQNDIVFHFNGINLNNDFIRYSYTLKGRDKIWLSNQKNNEAIYYNLSPAKYTFMVKAINDAGLESIIATYSFTIVPPFWQTWWFRTIIALLAISLIYWFIKNRDAKIEKENLVALQMSELKLTALQSQMNPHFIFNSLNSIQNYILQQKPIDAARYLSKFSRLMRRILDHSFNNLTPLNEIVETLKMYMELEAFRFSNEFTWEVKVEDGESINDVKLPPLLLQPYVENAIIHGLMPKQGEKRLLIRLYKSDKNELHCIIDDNGVGRGNKLTDKETGGHISRGQKLTTDMLATMKQLLHTDAQIKITDKVDDKNQSIGTTVDLIIPMTT